jgi:hypothetical protein
MNHPVDCSIYTALVFGFITRLRSNIVPWIGSQLSADVGRGFSNHGAHATGNTVRALRERVHSFKPSRCFIARRTTDRQQITIIKYKRKVCLLCQHCACVLGQFTYVIGSGAY